MDYSIDLAVDTSAMVAVLFQEAEAATVLQALSAYGRIGISAANKTELLMVVGSRLGMAGRDKALELMARYQIVTVPIDDALAELAVQAFFNYGKGRHPAGLNYGDCFSYALQSTSKRRCCSRGMISQKLILHWQRSINRCKSLP